MSYIATIEHVQEIILVGTADLNFWRAKLQRENLFPFNANGKAQITISATQMKWQGMPMREFVVSVTTCDRADENLPDAAFLLQAFNSSRLMAFSERAFFQTPYVWGKIQTDADIPVSITLDDGDVRVFRAAMSGERKPMRAGDELLEGAIYLPQERNRVGGVFYARLGGYTEVYPFTTGADTLELKISTRAPVFQALVESQFALQEWRIRPDATHARSKTFRRN